MRSYVIFKDSKVFSKEQLWDLGQVLLKYGKSDIKIHCVGRIEVKASNDKVLQEGVLIQAENVSEAIGVYETIKRLGNG